MSNVKIRHKVILIVIMFALLLLSFKLFTLARFKNRVSTSLNIWNGEVATSYRSGTGSEDDPYIISNGEELAYFSSRLENNDYENTYFKISNDIILNEGTFEYSDNKIKYILNGNTYYVKDGDYYDNDSFTGDKVGTLNEFLSINEFKGTLDGDYHTIYGIYNDSTDSSLFSELDGTVSSLYIDNSLMLGSNTSSLLAKTMNGAVINNIMVNGIVINNCNSNIENEISIDSISLNPNESREISIPEISDKGIIRITGNITNTFGIKVIINGNEYLGEFDSVLDGKNTITIQNSNDSLSLVEFTNVKYIEISTKGLASGIVIEANNSTISNCINKANIYSDYSSSGVVSIVDNTNISNSYNVGNIDSIEYSGAIVNYINNSNIIMDKIYNEGTLTGKKTALLNVLNTANLLLNNSFVATDNYIINELYNSSITGSYNYYVSSNKGIESSTLTSIENLKDKNFLLNYSEFVDFDNLKSNDDNIWVFDEDSYPKLFIDDKLNPNAKLYVNTYEWDSYSHILDRKIAKNKIVFSIADKDILTVAKEKYYYISNSTSAINKTELNNLEWIQYSKPVEISTEGYYVIYVKIIDNNDNISYINSDLIILDNSPSEITISMGDYEWNTISSGSIYTNCDQNIYISADDSLSGIKSLEYFYSDEYLDQEDLENYDDWISYTEGVNIGIVGKHYLYVKAVNNIDYVNYASTPKIIYDGYNINSLIPFGFSSVSNNITSNSKMMMKVSYNNNEQIKSGEHYLMSNILLPEDTVITLIDNTNKKAYGLEIDDQYSIDEGTFKYPFTDFVEKGKTNNVNYIESTVINEDFTVIVDFSNATINEDIKNIYIAINVEKNNKIVRAVLDDNYKYFNIYSNNTLKISHSINSDFSGSILYNSDSSNVIKINNIINYKTYLDNTIYDTDYSDKKSGLVVTMIDSNNNIMDYKYLKNLSFMVNDSFYTAGADNKIRINLNTNVSSIVDLNVVTHKSSSVLNDGTYYLKISGYSSYDGLYYDEEINDSILIPIIIDNSKHDDNYIFDISLPIEKRILETKDTITNLNFNINVNNLDNPTIMVSFYKKDEITAYNQDYSLIDLADYVTDDLVTYVDKVYYLSNNSEFSINLKTNMLEKTGYKMVFDLYVDGKLLGSVNKYFVVR